ncbi:restriction endonuclease subunit S [Mycoplasma sp. Z244B]|uniref:restriction endonuclease subunit S n=1 Tax=Mycoplasma sp. Z244B TaxID=3401659 RepID=UPI003AAE6DDA
MQKEKLVPEIRFKGFNEDWNVNRLSSYLSVVVRRNEQLSYSQNEVLSVSKDSGVINQIKYLGRSYAGSDLRNYKILELSHIVYTKSPLNETPFGIIKTNNYEQGIVSTLYATYEPSSVCHPNFIEHYFSKYDRLNNYLHPLVNKGAKNTLLIRDEAALGGYVIFPSFDEQQKISDLLDNLAMLIQSQELKLKKLNEVKQSLLIKMFASKNQKFPEIRFKGFVDAWSHKLVKNLGYISTGNSNTQDSNINGIYPFFIRSDKLLKSDKYLYDEEAVITIGDGNIGKVFHYVNGKFDLHQRCYKISNFNNILGKYFYWYFSSNFYERVIKMSAKATVDSVRLEMIADMDICYPFDIKEQLKISAFLDSLDSLISSQELKLEKLNNIKQALLEKMFC